jgi:hypothetical protein
MFRECVATLVFAAMCPACSLILDFDEAPPADAGIDAVSSQTDCDFGEPNNTLAEAFAVTSADTGPGAICPGAEEDHDFYTFTAGTGPTTISISFTPRTGGDLDLKLYDASGAMIASSREFGATESITCPNSAPLCPALTAGMAYTFEVFPGIPNALNSYTFSIAP